MSSFLFCIIQERKHAADPGICAACTLTLVHSSSGCFCTLRIVNSVIKSMCTVYSWGQNMFAFRIKLSLYFTLRWNFYDLFTACLNKIIDTAIKWEKRKKKKSFLWSISSICPIIALHKAVSYTLVHVCTVINRLIDQRINCTPSITSSCPRFPVGFI